MTAFDSGPRAHEYLRALGVRDLPPLTSPFDPGYDPATLAGHLAQSSHLISILKISMATWIIADENVSRQKLAHARERGVKTVTGGGPFEIAVAQGQLPAYLDLCADFGFERIECGEGFTQLRLEPEYVVSSAHARSLEVQFELGLKHEGPFDATAVQGLVEKGRRWMAAGAAELVMEARESAQGVGLFDEHAAFNARFADIFATAFGLDLITFEAPTKASQFALLSHFGPHVRLCNVRLEELLRVEIFRRGLHSDSFAETMLRPRARNDQADG